MGFSNYFKQGGKAMDIFAAAVPPLNSKLMPRIFPAKGFIEEVGGSSRADEPRKKVGPSCWPSPGRAKVSPGRSSPLRGAIAMVGFIQYINTRTSVVSQK